MPRNAEVIRQWSVLRELEASRRETIASLARKTEVTTRTIRRDLEALQTAGFPIYDELIDGKRFWKLDTRPFKALGDTGFSLSGTWDESRRSHFSFFRVGAERAGADEVCARTSGSAARCGGAVARLLRGAPRAVDRACGSGASGSGSSAG